MPHRAPPDERLGHLRHADGALHPGGHPDLLQGILQSERIDHRRQHAHVIAGGAFNPPLAAAQAAKDIPAAYHHYHLHPQLPHLAYLRRHVLHGLRRNVHPRRATQGFSAQFQ